MLSVVWLAQQVNLVGAGMMVGTALGVIIPEGAGAFYSAYPGM